MEKDFLKLMLHENIKQLFYFQKKYVIANFGNDALDFISMGIINIQGCNARKVNCGGVYSAYILKPVLSGRNCKQCISVCLISEEGKSIKFR